MSTDLYAEKYKDYPEEELLEIINNTSSFGEYARLGAIQALEAQKGNSTELDSLRNVIQGITETIDTDEEVPTLYSKLLIRMFALFFGTIFGVILLMHNMKVTKNNTGRWQVLAFGIMYMMLGFVILSKMGLQSNYSVLINLIGGFILTEFFWNRFIGRTASYEKKGWIKPTIIAIIVIVPLTYLYRRQLGMI